MRARQHNLKTLPRYFGPLADGRKTFEVRRDDRHYLEGDLLVLKEFDPAVPAPQSRHLIDERFTGREIDARVTYVLPGGRFGVDPEYVVLGIDVIRARP